MSFPTAWQPIPWLYRYLDEPALSAIGQYTYKAEDHSLMAKYIMQPFWNRMVTFLPATIAANMITLIGFVINVSAFSLTCYYAPTLQDDCPSWVWFFAAAALFTYQLLDALDGKQARRTQTSSPVGELFDHGCDALSTPMICLTLCNALRSPDYLAFAYTAMISGGFYLAQWEQFNTGNFVLGYINGPTDGVLINIMILLFTGIYGQDFWKNTVYGYPLWQLLNVGIALLAALTFTVNVLHALTLPKQHKVYNSRFGTLVPGFEAVCVLTILIVRFPGELLNRNTRIVAGLLGVLLCYTATRLTVSRVTRMKFKVNFSLLGPLHLIVFVFFMLPSVSESLPFALEEETLRSWVVPSVTIYLFLAVYFYLHLVLSIFHQMTKYLGINLLTMTPTQRTRALELLNCSPRKTK